MTIISKRRRNALFEAVGQSGLPADEFSYAEIPGFSREISDKVEIVHTSSDSRFIIYPDRESDSFHYASRVGDDPWAEMNVWTDFNVIAIEVRNWSKELDEWIDSPDLWRSISDTATIPGELTPDSANTPFSHDEQAVISVQLREVAESIKKIHELTAEQSAEIDKKFEEAEKASQRMGRKDWGTFFGGIALSLVLADIITPAVMGHIFMMIEHGIGYLFGGPPAGGILSGGGD